MNKRNILIISIATIVPATIGLVICQKNVSPFHVTKADTTEHTITLTADDLDSPKIEDGYLTYDLYQENATKCGEDFMVLDSYAYSDDQISYGSGHIFSMDGGLYYDALFFGMTLEFDNVAEYVSVTLNGKFCYNSQKTSFNYQISYGPSSFSDDQLIIYEDGLYTAELDSIVIIYLCA